MTHNTIFERLVDQSNNRVEGYVAYCLYKHGKREWIRQFEAAHRRAPDEPELMSYVSSYTDQPIAALQAQASTVLAAFAENAVASAKPNIVETALRGSFSRSVWESISANAIYTLLLIAVVIILKASGVDLLGLARTVGN